MTNDELLKILNVAKSSPFSLFVLSQILVN